MYTNVEKEINLKKAESAFNSLLQRNSEMALSQRKRYLYFLQKYDDLKKQQKKQSFLGKLQNNWSTVVAAALATIGVVSLSYLAYKNYKQFKMPSLRDILKPKLRKPTPIRRR